MDRVKIFDELVVLKDRPEEFNQRAKEIISQYINSLPTEKKVELSEYQDKIYEILDKTGSDYDKRMSALSLLMSGNLLRIRDEFKKLNILLIAKNN